MQPYNPADNLTRRKLLQHSLGVAAAAGGLSVINAQGAVPPLPATSTTATAVTQPRTTVETDPQVLANDEVYWANIARDFDVNPDIINLENGNWGIMSRPVLQRYGSHTEQVNRDNSYYARGEFGADYGHILAQLAIVLGVTAAELTITRNATEALQALVLGYQQLTAGDALMFADLDYDSIQQTMRSHAQQQGCAVVELSIPEPINTSRELVAFYAQALDEHPEVRLLLLTHVSHRTGLVMPVKEIAALARQRSVDVIVDAAHSWGQIDFKLPDLDADFVGLNLHKWLGAPIGVGLMYVKAKRLSAIATNPSAGDWEAGRLSGRVHTGTMNYAAILSIPDALDYHQYVGPANKAARLRYLRDVWVSEVRDIPGLQILTPDIEGLSAGITSFRVTGVTTTEGNKHLAARLLAEHKVFTVHRNGVAAGACIRVTPSIYNTADDCRTLARGLRKMLAS
ncbi:MAG: aminotransferase class V-fold PLP-dependent enzyme [Pseudomonadales bacterium]|nr:aminotransferase class V-fold PLP-dependent enzyme [Pseudomonadales bacterium]